MTAGYSSTPLVKKLGLKAGMTAAVLDPPLNYWDLLVGRPDDLAVVGSSASGIDFVHLFVRERKHLRSQLKTLRARIAPNGMIWVSWPKTTSDIQTDLTANVVRREGLSAEFVDVKVCAVDEVWSGLKFVIRKADRR